MHVCVSARPHRPVSQTQTLDTDSELLACSKDHPVILFGCKQGNKRSPLLGSHWANIPLGSQIRGFVIYKNEMLIIIF